MPQPDRLLVLGGDDVARLLPMPDCIELMAATLRALADGRGVLPLRTVVATPDRRGSLYVMPALAAEPDALAVKLISVFPGNHGGPLPSHQGVVVLFDADDGRPLALIDAAELTAIRTAAVSAVATRALARKDAASLALIGSGVQARTHLAAIRAVRPLRQVRVWSRTPEHAREFAVRESRRHDIEVEAFDSAEHAVRAADVICTVTAARTPVVRGAWLAAGAHVNAVGASTPDAREIDTDTVRNARVFVDSSEAAFAEAGDIIIPVAERAIAPDHIAGELGDVLTGSARGRTARDELTVFKSLGLAIEDAAAARLLYERASSGGSPVASVRMPPRSTT